MAPTGPRASKQEREPSGPRIRMRPPGPKSRAYFAQEAKLFGSRHAAHRKVPFVLARQYGSLLEDVDGNRYIDFSSAWGTNNLGNVHPEVLEVAQEYLGRFGVTCLGWPAHEPMFALARQLRRILPRLLRNVALELGGTSAVETTLKLMRASRGHRPNILGFLGNYQGYSYGAVGAGPVEASTSAEVFNLVNGFLHVPYAYCYRCPYRLTYPSCDLWCVDYIEEWVLRYLTTPDRIAGIIVEPVQGEAGTIVPPPGYLERLERLCRKHGWLFTVDEVQTGFGRCGSMFAFEQTGLQPDLVPLAKGLSGGLIPLGAVVGTDEAFQNGQPVGGTFAGNAAACAIAAKNIEILLRDRIPAHAARLGVVARRRLTELREAHRLIGDVRGTGLFWTLELVEPGKAKRPALKAIKRVFRGCVERGLFPLVDEGMPYALLRIQPPLTISQELFEEGLDLLDAALVAEERRR